VPNINFNNISILERIICVLCVYICHYIIPFYYLDIVFRHTETENTTIKVITKLPNSEQSYKGKVKTHNYINRQNQTHKTQIIRSKIEILLKLMLGTANPYAY
jgi:hypothetical protein